MRSGRNSGFTLIEVLIAFAILALVLGVVFRTYSSGLSQERIAGSTTARLLGARSIVDRLGIEIPLEEGSVAGQLATGEDWTLTITPVELGETEDEGTDAIRAYLAELSIAGADGRSLRLQTLKLGP